MLCLDPALTTKYTIIHSLSILSFFSRLNFLEQPHLDYIHQVLPSNTEVNLLINVATIQYPAGYGQNPPQALHGRHPRGEID